MPTKVAVQLLADDIIAWNMRVAKLVFILLILFPSCATPERDRHQDTKATPPVIVHPSLVSSDISPSSTPSATVRATTPATAEPTYTATPTATAVPITVVGNPRTIGLQEPAVQEGAICGLVDLFDFPLEPPHARNIARGGTDFGIYRSSFGKYHAGEDWWISGGRSSLGTPVYSIGHGRVTYSEPLGWGRDQGVVIVRHTFADGRELLSFYGHLDPDSFKVASGDCVARGDLIGKIGKPRTGPHLHFEVRSQMPLEPGTGYWSEDPMLAGWKPPSATIWNSRMVASPGVLWTQHFASDGVRSVEALGEEIFIIFDGEHIVGLDLTDGKVRWQAPVGDDVEQVLLNTKARQIYTATQFGVVTALVLPDEDYGAEINEPKSFWQVDLDVVGIPTLMPLPHGGLVLSSWDQLIALSAEGDLLWEADLGARPYDWLVTGDTLIVTTTGSLWMSDADGLQRWHSDIGGHLAAAGDHVLLYDGRTLFRLETETSSVEALFELPGGNLQVSDVAALSGGGAIITHASPSDRRLMALDSEGILLWERSVADFPARSLNLFADQNQVFLVPQNSGDDGSEVSLFAVALDEARVTHLFTGGTRDSQVDQTKLFGIGNGRILINIDGRSLAVLDTEEAEHLVSSITTSSR